MFIESIQAYPLTGARAVTPSHPRIEFDGLANSHLFVAYDPDTMSRVSTKPGQAPELHRIQPLFASGGVLELCDEDGESVDKQLCLPVKVGKPDILVEEFGDLIPATDLGEEMAYAITDFLGKSVRLARRELKGFPVAPKDRAVAPLHITTTASQRWVAEHTGLSEFEVMRRFRPDIVINNDGAEPFEELNWQQFNISTATVVLHRPTLRCPVPSQDPFTGKNMKDIAKIYPDLPHRDDSLGRSKPVFGMYGYVACRRSESFMIEMGQNIGQLERVGA